MPSFLEVNNLTDMDRAIKKDISPAAPSYENNLRSKMMGYNLVIRFPTCPNPDDQVISFPAYIKSVDDNFSVNYQQEKIYGRMDPIPIYNGTTRAMSFSLDIPSNGLEHSRLIRNKLDKLVKNLYPSYEQSTNGVKIISSPPLAALFFSNFINDPISKGYLLGYFSSGINIKHDMTDGVFARGSGHEVYPKFYSLSFSFSVLHTFTPGYDKTTGTNPMSILKSIKD